MANIEHSQISPSENHSQLAWIFPTKDAFQSAMVTPGFFKDGDDGKMALISELNMVLILAHWHDKIWTFGGDSFAISNESGEGNDG